MRRLGWSNWKLVARVLVVGLVLALADAPSSRAAPAPVPVSVVNTAPTATDDVNSVVGCSATPPGTQIVGTSAGRQAIIIQNLSNVVVCVSKSTTAMSACPPAGASSTAGAFILKAGTAANDGTGGTISFSQYSGPIACLSSNGTANVSALSFAR